MLAQGRQLEGSSDSRTRGDDRCEGHGLSVHSEHLQMASKVGSLLQGSPLVPVATWFVSKRRCASGSGASEAAGFGTSLVLNLVWARL